MTAFISALSGAGGISASTFFDVLTPLVPVILILVGVTFTITVVRKLVKGAAKGKLKF